MAKSVFLLNSGRRKMKAQFRRLREALQETALKLEGPFRDDNGSLSKLSDEVKAGPKGPSTANPAIATMLALGPQNQPFSSSSWLERPFILGDNPEGLDCGSAGEMAQCKTISRHGRQFRSLDLESLTLLTVAVLRRLHVPALFAYQHIDPEQPEVMQAALLSLVEGVKPVLNPVPSIVMVGDKRLELRAFCPPELCDFPGGRLIKGLEVLGDDALGALMEIKTAHARMEELMHDVAANDPLFKGERAWRAIGIGHQFYEGISSWPLHEGDRTLGDCEALVNEGKSGLMSVRRLAEMSHVHHTACPTCHTMLASETLLEEDDIMKIVPVLNAITRKDFDLVIRVIGNLPQSDGMSNLHAYMKLGRRIKEHVHPAVECNYIDRSASN